MDITLAVAEKVRDTVAQGLTSGMGEPIPGRMCVEAAVCYALGLPHGDDPGCVSPSLRRLKIGLNEAKWSSPMARAEGLKRLALIQLGSLGVLDDAEFSRRVVEMTIRKAVPVGLRAAATCNPAYATRLESAAQRCEREGSRESALEAYTASAASSAAAAYYATASAADDASSAAAAAAYAAAAYTTASAAAAAAADASSCSAAAAAADACYAYTAAAASAAANASAYAAASAADSAAHTRDRALTQYADWVVDLLIDMQAPGVQWLGLLG